MIVLDEQIKEAKNKAFEEWEVPIYTIEGAFNAGFNAGLNYNKARLVELEALVKELKELCLEAERYIGGIPLDSIDFRDADSIIDKLDKASAILSH